MKIDIYDVFERTLKLFNDTAEQNICPVCGEKFKPHCQIINEMYNIQKQYEEIISLLYELAVRAVEIEDSIIINKLFDLNILQHEDEEEKL